MQNSLKAVAESTDFRLFSLVWMQKSAVPATGLPGQATARRQNGRVAAKWPRDKAGTDIAPPCAGF